MEKSSRMKDLMERRCKERERERKEEERRVVVMNGCRKCERISVDLSIS